MRSGPSTQRPGVVKAQPANNPTSALIPHRPMAVANPKNRRNQKVCSLVRAMPIPLTKTHTVSARKNLRSTRSTDELRAWVKKMSTNPTSVGASPTARKISANAPLWPRRAGVEGMAGGSRGGFEFMVRSSRVDLLLGAWDGRRFNNHQVSHIQGAPQRSGVATKRNAPILGAARCQGNERRQNPAPVFQAARAAA